MASPTFFERQLFNNPNLADAVVTITTEPEDGECMGGSAAATRSHDEQGDQRVHQTQQVYANTCILSANSEFFNACTRWQPPPSKRRRTGSPEDSLSKPEMLDITVSVLPEEMSAAREMIRFMYTQQLPDGVESSDILALYHLADRYMLPNLQVACLQHLQHQPLHEWGHGQQQQLFSMASKFSTQARVHAGKPLGAAAAALIDALASILQQQLEVFWRKTDNRLAFMSLPHEVVLRVLRCDTLAVRSEDTVLVVALSWLRGDVGSAAAAEQRRRVLEAVRLLQLSPWFLHCLLLQHAHEAKELLSSESLLQLTVHTHRDTSSSARARLECVHPLMKQWATRRAGVAPAPVQVRISCDKAVVQSAVEDVRAGREGMHRVGEPVFGAGLDCKAAVVVDVAASGKHAGCIMVWVGILPSVWLGGTCEEISQFLFSFTGIWGTKRATNTHRRGRSKHIASDDDAELELRPWCVGDALVFSAEL